MDISSNSFVLNSNKAKWLNIFFSFIDLLHIANYLKIPFAISVHQQSYGEGGQRNIRWYLGYLWI